MIIKKDFMFNYKSRLYVTRLSSVLIMIVMLCFVSVKSFATTRTWTGAGGNNNWTTPGNWGGTAPVAGDDLIFSGNTRALTNSNDFPAGTSFTSITFAPGVTTSFTLSGNAIAISSFIDNQKTSLTMTISFAINFGASLPTVTVAGGGTLVLSGSLTGTAGLTKAGTGILTLGAPPFNQWTGPTTVTAGTMNGGSQNGSDYYQTSGITVNSGATFIQPAGSANNTLENNMIVTADGTFNMNGNQDLIGYIAGSGTISNVGVAAAMGLWLSMPGTGSGSNFSGVLSGPGFMQFSGGGKQILSGLNTYTGQTIIQSGIVNINTIKNIGAANFSSLGSPTTAANGTIKIGNTTNTGTLLYTGAVTSSTNRVIDLAGTTGGAVLDQSATGDLTFTSNFTASGVGVKTLTLQGSSTGKGIISGKIVNSAGNATSVIKQGSGTWSLSGANTYTGNTTISGGTLAIGASNAIPSTSVVVMDGGILDASSFGSAMGKLNFQTAGSKIKLGSGTASFAASASVAWSGTFLFVDGWSGGFNCTAGTGGKLIIGSGNSTAVD
jgi:autotransporter-associated beta strand protein